jgi:hypothetical protein
MVDDPVPPQEAALPDISTDGSGGDAPLKWRGNSRAYLIQRLKEAGRHDLVDAIEARRISARAAAQGLGWLREYQPRSAGDPRIQRRLFERTAVFGGAGPSRISILFELWLGPNDAGSVFKSRQELIDAWKQYGPEAMARWGSNGRRPQAWWEFSAPPGLERAYATERSTLYDAGLLGIDEAARLEAEWRKEFDRAQTCFRTDAERRRFYREIDLPDSLRKQWEAERRRRARKDPPAGGAGI